MSESKNHSVVLCEAPPLTDAHLAALAKIHGIHRRLRAEVGNPKRWTGTVRDVLAARSIRQSTKVEGYEVTADEALTIIHGDSDGTGDVRVVENYQRAMTFVLQLADDKNFTHSTATINALQFMIAEDDLTKHPGRYRDHAVFVPTGDGESYTPPSADDVVALMDALVDRLNDPTADPLIEAAMGHLNLVGVHPYEDGNGRVSRVLQALVLARAGLPPELCSIEEYIGRNTPAFYVALAAVDRGEWSPTNDATPWIEFCLEAHWQQANETARDLDEAARIYAQLDDLIDGRALPVRAVDALYVATIGGTLTNSSYRAEAGIDDPQTASRDLARLANGGLLDKAGDRRGAEYTAAAPLRQLRAEVRADRAPVPPLFD